MEKNLGSHLERVASLLVCLSFAVSIMKLHISSILVTFYGKYLTKHVVLCAYFFALIWKVFLRVLKGLYDCLKAATAFLSLDVVPPPRQSVSQSINIFLSEREKMDLPSFLRWR